MMSSENAGCLYLCMLFEVRSLCADKEVTYGQLCKPVRTRCILTLPTLNKASLF